MQVSYHLRAPVDDHQLTLVHGRAFGMVPTQDIPWGARLARHSLTWVVAGVDDILVGFVNVISDGGAHAVLLDTVVDPPVQGRGIGRAMVAVAVDSARLAGCRWLHVDYEPELAAFYRHACGFGSTDAGLMRLG